jgi:hypothetical protein
MPPDEGAKQVDAVSRGNLTGQSVREGGFAPRIHEQIRSRKRYQRGWNRSIGRWVAGERLHSKQFCGWARYRFCIFC